MGPPSRYAKYAAASRSSPYYTSPSPQFFYHSSESDASLDSQSVEPEDLSDAEWARHHFAALARASTPAEFSERASKCLSRQVNVTVNGMHVSRELYARQWGAAAVGTSGNVNAKGAIVFHGAPVETQAMRIPMHQVRLHHLFWITPRANLRHCLLYAYALALSSDSRTPFLLDSNTKQFSRSPMMTAAKTLRARMTHHRHEEHFL